MNELNTLLDFGQQKNAATVGAKFKTIRFYLDSARSRGTNGYTDHVFGSGIKSFWVSDTNNRNFVAKIVPNFRTDRKENTGLPLRYNMNQKFALPVDDACLEFEAQAGVWVDIVYSESEDISIGSSDISLTGSVSPDEGSTFSMEKKSANATPALLLSASTSVLKSVIQHKSGGSVWIGSEADLLDSDYQNICFEVKAGQNVEWWGRGALYFRDASSTSIVQVTRFTA